MSRTTRKPLRVIEENEETYIKRSLNRRIWRQDRFYSSKVVRRKKHTDEYEAEWQAAWDEYNEKLKKASRDEDGRPYILKTWRYDYSCGERKFGLYPDYLREPYVSRYHRIEIPWSIEQEIEELKKEYREFTRDGHWNETGRNTGFKETAAKVTRIGNRRLERKIMKDDDYDHLPYPNEHDGDFHRWSFW